MKKVNQDNQNKKTYLDTMSQMGDEARNGWERIKDKTRRAQERRRNK